MNLQRVVPAAVLTFISAVATAAPIPHILDVNQYSSFNPASGILAELDQSLNIQLFAVGFANQLFLPHQNYSVNLTGLGSGSDLSETRFGGVTSWTPVFLGGDVTDAKTINSANALARYQMAAYLTSEYNPKAGSPQNDGIEAAIQQILDPKYSTLTEVNAGGVEGNSTPALEGAAQWYRKSVKNHTLNSFLANYRIVSDTGMLPCEKGWAKCGGFSEQITVVPEPLHPAMFLMGLFVIGSVAFRKILASRALRN